MPDHLLAALGGPDGIDAMTVALYRQIASDPMLAATFAGHDIFAIHQHMRDFLITAVDGRPSDHQRLQRAHRSLQISDVMFDATVGHVAAVLAESGVVDGAIDGVRRLLSGLRSLIVTGAASPPADETAGDVAFHRFRQLTSIVAFWRAVAAARGGTVVVDPGFAAIDVSGRHEGGRGFVLNAAGVPRALEHFAGQHPILWTRDAASSDALVARGLRPIARRSALTAQLSDVPEPSGTSVAIVEDPAVLFATEPAAVAELTGVVGLTAYAGTECSGVAMFRAGTDALVVHLESAAGPGADRRTESTLAAGLTQQRAYGARTATLSVAADRGPALADLGFTVVDRWEAFA